jgi:hypothetical protein
MMMMMMMMTEQFSKTFVFLHNSDAIGHLRRFQCTHSHAKVSRPDKAFTV